MRRRRNGGRVAPFRTDNSSLTLRSVGGRPRIYATNAARQAAYRRRRLETLHEEQMALLMRALAAMPEEPGFPRLQPAPDSSRQRARITKVGPLASWAPSDIPSPVPCLQSAVPKRDTMTPLAAPRPRACRCRSPRRAGGNRVTVL